jgi:hypothetical protein
MGLAGKSPSRLVLTGAKSGTKFASAGTWSSRRSRPPIRFRNPCDSMTTRRQHTTKSPAARVGASKVKVDVRLTAVANLTSVKAQKHLRFHDKIKNPSRTGNDFSLLRAKPPRLPHSFFQSECSARVKRKAPAKVNRGRSWLLATAFGHLSFDRGVIGHRTIAPPAEHRSLLSLLWAI